MATDSYFSRLSSKCFRRIFVVQFCINVWPEFIHISFISITSNFGEHNVLKSHTYTAVHIANYDFPWTTCILWSVHKCLAIMAQCKLAIYGISYVVYYLVVPV